MSERWMPKNLEIYWSVIDTTPMQFAWQGNPLEIARWEAGNVFKTHDKALVASINIKSLLLSLHEEQPVTDCNQLPKLTAEVFNRPDCPEWAQYAAVDVQGLAYWYQHSPVADERIGVWRVWGTERRLIGFFDRSDWQNSLVERPKKETKLPEWCKVGEWVYCTKTNNYGKILSVDKEKVNICIPPDETFSAKTNMMLKYGRTARLRPFNAEEMRGLVGKVIEVEPGQFSLCLRVKGRWADFLDDCANEDDRARIISYDCDMLKHINTIDGQLCGVLEHLENGEWVE